MLIFRYDDYSAAQRMDVAIDDAVFGMFRAYQIPLTVGVTPSMAAEVHDPECDSYAELGSDPHRVDMLKAGLDSGWELALHGLTHRRSKFRDNTEFAASPRREQMARLQTGREKLQAWFPNAPLAVFLPPWNSYDGVTVASAASSGFQVLCAGPETQPATRGDLRIIPSAVTGEELVAFVQLFGVPRLRDALGDASVVVTLHEFEFKVARGPNWRPLVALESILAEIGRAGIPCGTVGRANPADCDISRHPDLVSKLDIARRFLSPEARLLASVVRATPDGPARELVVQIARGGVSALQAWSRATHQARVRTRPARWKLRKSMEVLAGRVRPGPRHRCPFCDFEGCFSRRGDRPHATCPRCGSLERHRFILATVGPLLALGERPRRALMFAPDAVLSLLRSRFDQVVTTDIARGDVDVVADMQRLPFPDGSFDCIVATHVLDEVEDDGLGLRECRRVLSEGGRLLAPVPIHDSAVTLELAERREDGKVRLAGRDYPDRITAAGFRLTAAFEPLDEAFAALHEEQNICTPNCVAGTEGVAVFEKRG